MKMLNHYLKEVPISEQRTEVIAYLASLDHLFEAAPTIASAILQELKDQGSYLKLIASENFCSLTVQLAMGNLLTDKYAEGYPQHRFYAGCDNVDQIEIEAQETLKKLFGAEHAYVQPHSGADANLVAFWSILVQKVQNKEIEKLGKKSLDELSPEEYERIRKLMLSQKVMGLSLNSGGHLTHGYRHNVSSKMMQAVLYEVDRKTELLDYSVLQKQALEEKPTILLAGYSAHSRKLNFAKMREIADSVGAVLVVDMAHFAGLVAGKVFVGEFDPVPHAHIVTSTTHKTLRGPRGGFILCSQEFAETIDKGCPLVLGGPLPHIMAAKAIAFKEASTDAFKLYAQRIVENCIALSEGLKRRGVRLVSGGTENHLAILDLTSYGLTGRQAETALREAHLTVNRNAIPWDENGPWYTSGIRVGTAAVTTLGMGTAEMDSIAELIHSVLTHTKSSITASGKKSKAKCETDPGVLNKAKTRTEELLKQHPLYPELRMNYG